MHRLCSLARVTYSEFGMTFDRSITARNAPLVAELESPRASTPSRTFTRFLLPPASPDHGLENYALPSSFPACDAVPPLAERRLSLIHYCAFYPMFDPQFLAALLLSVAAPPPC